MPKRVGPVQDYVSLSQVLESQVKSSLIGRHVAWLKEPRASTGRRIAVKILAVAECCFLAISLVGLIPLKKAFSCSSKVDHYQGLKSEDAPAAPEIGSIEYKTKQQTFNHERDFVIHEGALWTRKRNEQEAPWELMYYDGGPNSEPIEIQADGTNLMVLDSEGSIHYKKVLKESREKGEYISTDLAISDNWRKAWFSFPGIKKIVNLINSNRKLQVPKDAIGWAASHRGVYNRFFEDMEGKEHPEFSMVTTVYLVPKGGRELRFADPYVSASFSKTIPIPKDLIIEKIAASASIIFLYGTVNGERKLFTRLADFDTLGKNVMLPGHWQRSRRGQMGWEEQSNFTQQGEVRAISIEQTGEGNEARRLHLILEDDEGEELHLSKMIGDEFWEKFKRHEN
jgi:hypothetical protein